MNPASTLTIDTLRLTVQVQLPLRAPLSTAVQEDAPRRVREQVLLAPPPEPLPQDRGEVTAAVRNEPESWSVENVDLEALADRVYEQMRAEVRLGLDRGGRLT